MTTKEREKYDTVQTLDGINWGGWSDDGIIYILKRVLKTDDPSSNESEVLRWACFYGREKAVSLLLKDGRVDPSAYDNGIIGYATNSKNLNIIKMLLKDKKVDPSANNYYSIYNAWSLGEPDIVRELLKHTPIIEITDLPQKYQEDTGFMELVNKDVFDRSTKRMGKFRELLDL